MWTRSYSKIFKDIKIEDVWKSWVDVKNWHKWNPGIEYCRIDGDFEVGSNLFVKPTTMNEVTMKLVEVDYMRKFTDCTVFPGAKMYGIHEFEKTKDGIKFTTTMKVEGWLSFIWIFLVAKKVVAKLPKQTENLVEFVKNRQ